MIADIVLPGVRAPLHKKIVWASLASLPTPLAVGIQFYQANGYLPNLKAPSTFNEKTVHRKLYDKDPRLVSMSDKVAVKDYVAGLLGDEWIIPHYWAGSVLPPRQERDWPVPFIIKANHASGWNYMVRTPEALDWGVVEEKIGRWVTTPWPKHHHEEFYNRFPRQAMAEQLVGPPDRSLNDYKFFVFHGRVEFVQVDVGRRQVHLRSFYDRDWKLQPFTRGYAGGDVHPEQPTHLSAMVEAAEALGRDFDFVRIDLYDLDDRPRFGEISFVPDSGFSKFAPRSYDRKLGDMWGGSSSA